MTTPEVLWLVLALAVWATIDWDESMWPLAVAYVVIYLANLYFVR